jgi:hypothetical protein
MQAIPVNSECPKKGCNDSEQVGPRRLLVGAAKGRGEICPSNHFCFFLGHARFGFLVKKIFSAIKNKIHFFLVDFETGF